MHVLFKKLQDDAIIPVRATDNSAGFDLFAAEAVTVYHNNGNHLVKTGIAVRMPPNTYGRIAMRSGLAVREHLAVSAGVIDRDYDGGLGVVVFRTLPPANGGTSYYTIKKGERFAQLVVENVCMLPGLEVDEFPPEDMYQHVGFGSTGEM